MPLTQPNPTGVFERGRTVADGEWVNAPWDATWFTPQGGSISNIVVNSFAYTQIGKTMVVSIWFSFTAVNVNTSIAIRFPAGVSSAMTQFGGAAQITTGAGANTDTAGNMYTVGVSTTFSMGCFNSTNLNGACRMIGTAVFNIQ